MRICIIVIIFSLFQLMPFNSEAQLNVDSLKRSIKDAEKNKKLEIYKHLSFEYLNISIEQSIKYSKKAIEILEEQNKQKEISVILNDIGLNYYSISDYTKALDCFIKSLEIKEKINDKKGIGNTYNNIGNIYQKKNDFDMAIEYYLMSLNLRKEINDNYGIASSMDNIGKVYIEKKEYKKALEMLNYSLEISSDKGLIDIQKRNYKNLSNLYLGLKNYETSLNYFKEFKKISDSVFKLKVNKEITHLKQNYDSEKREEANILLKKDVEFNQSRTRLYQIIAFVIFISAAIIIFFVFLNCRNKKKVFKALENKDIKISDQKALIEDTLGKYQDTKDRNEAILEALPDVMFVVDTNGKFIDYHASSRENLFLPPEEFINKSMFELLPKNVSDQYFNAIKGISEVNVLQTFDYELKIDGKNEKYEARIVKTEKNEFLSIVRNVTQERQTGNDLKNAKEVAEAANKAKSLVMASLSHEIRTPLSSIIGVTSILEETPLTEEQNEYLNVITISGNNLLYLINNILDFSKLDAGKIKIEKYKFNLQQVVNDVMKMLEFKAVDEDLKISTEIEKTIPQIVIGDEIRLTQVLVNLVNNALKFTKRGEVKIKVEKFDQNVNSLRLKFSVIDTGEGVSFEERDRLFRDFSQANDSITRKYGGTGLGLSICKQLVTLMGGEIGLESEKNKGSNFWFTIVFDREEMVETKILDKPVSDIKKDVVEDKRVLSVLLVEDNLLNQKFAAAILKKVGHKVDIAENGKIGVEFFMKNKYDIVLMDIQMPVMDGTEATRNIRAYEKKNNLKETKIVAVTAYAMEGDKERFLSSGIDDYLAKPYKVYDLLALLNKL